MPGCGYTSESGTSGRGFTGIKGYGTVIKPVRYANVLHDRKACSRSHESGRDTSLTLEELVEEIKRLKVIGSTPGQITVDDNSAVFYCSVPITKDIAGLFIAASVCCIPTIARPCASRRPIASCALTSRCICSGC